MRDDPAAGAAQRRRETALWNGGDRMPWVMGTGVMFAVTDFDAAVRIAKERGAKIHMSTETPVCHIALGEDTEGNQFILHKRKQR